MKTFFKILLVTVGLLMVYGCYEQPETRNEWLSNLVSAVCVTLGRDCNLVESWILYLSGEEDKIVWLENNIKKVPADKIELNEDIYRLLTKARPTNEQYLEKYIYYRDLSGTKFGIMEKDEANEVENDAIAMQVDVVGSTPISTYPDSGIYIDRVPSGTKVEILETVVMEYGGTIRWNVKWYRVKYLDKEGWISEACTKGYEWKEN